MCASNKEDTGPGAWVRRLGLVAVASGLAAAGGMGASWAAAPERLSDSRQWNEYEREAVRIATEFTAAWDMGDTQETASYVGKNFEYRSDPSYGVVRGRDAFLKRISHQRPSRHWPLAVDEGCPGFFRIRGSVGC